MQPTVGAKVRRLEDIAESPACFAKACLISLDHDLEPMAGESDPGTGLDVAEFLSLHSPLCPVILDTSNFDGRLAMQNRLRAGGWTVATVPPREADWIQASWLPIARRLIGLCNSHSPFSVEAARQNLIEGMAA